MKNLRDYRNNFIEICNRILNKYFNHSNCINHGEEFSIQFIRDLMKNCSEERKSIIINDIAIYTLNSKGSKRITFFKEITKTDATTLFVRFDEVTITHFEYEFKFMEFAFMYVMPSGINNGKICKPLWEKASLAYLNRECKKKIKREFIKFIEDNGDEIKKFAKGILGIMSNVRI